MAETLQAEPRKSLGKRNTRRLRAGGKVPAVIYGHGQETVSLAIPGDQMRTALRHGAELCNSKDR